jgi:hypothetical protein
MNAVQPDGTAMLVNQELLAGRYLAARARLLAAGGASRENLWNLWYWTLLAIDPWREGWPVAAGEPQAPADSLVNAEPDGQVVVEDLAAAAMAAGRVVVLMERHALPESRWAGVRLISVTAPYTFEPSRAALIREAMRAGLTLTAFDHPGDREQRNAILRGREVSGLDRQRERWMAENIQRLMAAEPAARIAIWTGGRHAWKRMPAYVSVPLFSSWAEDPTMAMVLAQLIGAEPWCLGQAVVYGPDRQPGAVRADQPWAAAHGLDAVLVHFRGARPRRPAWIAEGRRAVTLPAAGARLVQAMPAPEGPDAAPAAQAIAGNGRATLVLDPDHHLCRGVDDSERQVWQRAVDVQP